MLGKSWEDMVAEDEAGEEGWEQKKGANGRGLNFRQLFPANRIRKNGMKLEFGEPVELVPTLVLDKEDVAVGPEFWENALIGYVVGPTPRLLAVFDAGEDRDIDFEWWPLDIRELTSNPKEMGDELQLCKGGDGKSSRVSPYADRCASLKEGISCGCSGVAVAEVGVGCAFCVRVRVVSEHHRRWEKGEHGEDGKIDKQVPKLILLVKMDLACLEGYSQGGGLEPL
ncbi:hypothetical protein Cgig2_000960 [Carnegiea gigantea]|uniref:Uncharacterized protein n=1 Tax=Carnegiea gigantea TaxID=171969 RepID=A0A9Q1KMP9_9CARY|nr:hypothetical protein Cgig2_000960 [Carnegiea gigantea]